MFVIETNQETMDEGNWGLEWTIVGKGSSEKGEEEKETERSETDDDAGDDLVDEEVVGKSITEEEESGLKREGRHFMTKSKCQATISFILRC